MSFKSFRYFVHDLGEDYKGFGQIHEVHKPLECSVTNLGRDHSFSRSYAEEEFWAVLRPTSSELKQASGEISTTSGEIMMTLVEAILKEISRLICINLERDQSSVGRIYVALTETAWL